MARTAPVPNIPPIPGMCPSIAVMGGGGGGGGGGGKGGGTGDGSVGAGGDGSADGAGGDGSSAGSCGPGSGNGCSNPQHGNAGTTAAGDPVDVLTGRVFTVAARDLVLPGPIPLVFARSYSSTARARDVGLGHGWTHSLAWEVEVHRDRVTLWKADGRREVFDSLPVGEEGRTIDLVVRRHTSGFDVLRDRLRYELREVRGGQGSFSLSAIVDGYGNRIELGYDDRGRLAELRDSASRAVRLRWGDSGRIERVEAYNAAAQGQWCVFQRYVYDDVGDLVAATGAGGATHRYAYDRHLLVAHEAPSRRTTHYVYDASARCVETWVDYPGGADESLDCDVPRLLADGLTKAKGVLHVKIDAQDDYVEVADSRSVRRYFRNALGKFDKAVVGGGVSTNRYDPQGRLLAHTDPLGATWTWRLDPWGRLDSTTDPLGGETRYLYDAAGRLREALDPCGRRMRYDRNAQGDVTLESDDLGPLLRFAYDTRGLLTQLTMPNGGSTFFEYDDQGNRVRVREPSGGERHIRYDYFGTPVACVDEHGAETRFLWDASHRLTSLRYADGSSVDFEFDALGRLTALRSARGQRFELRWSGFDAVVEVRRPNGTRVAFRYDREGELVRVVNENDEEHRIVRDGVGHVVEELSHPLI